MRADRPGRIRDRRDEERRRREIKWARWTLVGAPPTETYNWCDAAGVVEAPRTLVTTTTGLTTGLTHPSRSVALRGSGRPRDPPADLGVDHRLSPPEEVDRPAQCSGEDDQHGDRSLAHPDHRTKRAGRSPDDVDERPCPEQPPDDDDENRASTIGVASFPVTVSACPCCCGRVSPRSGPSDK